MPTAVLPHYTMQQYSQPNFVDYMFENKLDKGRCTFDVVDETDIETTTKLFMLNVIFWEPIMQFGILPRFDDIANIEFITNDSISVIHTNLYEVLLDNKPDVPHMELVSAIVENVDRLYSLIRRYMGNYMPAIDSYGLVKLIENPEIKAITSVHIDDVEGTKVAEQKLKHAAGLLTNKLADPNLKDNCLFPYIRANTLKKNQIPQVLTAYGPRADIDDTMKKHIVRSSSFSGVSSIEDFAIEALSAKKSIYLSRSGIRISQYFARKLRLACSLQKNIYPGSCGNVQTIDLIIPKESKKNYIHNAVLDERGNKIFLTEDNINDYVDRKIQYFSPCTCRYKDGICEYCAGYGKDRLIKYMPPNIHIGMLASSKTSSQASQTILSNKHLIETFSKLYNLPPTAAKYLYRNEDALFWNPEMTKRFSGLKMRIPTDAVSLVTDLNLENLPMAEMYSKIPYMDLMRDDKVVETIHLESEEFVPYLSDATLEYMRSQYRNLTLTEEYITIPLDNIDPKAEFMKFIIVNDDVMTYTKRVIDFLSNAIGNYTSISDCLRDFANIVHSRASLNVFFLEMVMKAFLITSKENYEPPTVTDPNKVMFGNLANVVSESSVSGKLAFEWLRLYLSSPKTSTVVRPVGLFGEYFGII